MKLGNKVSFSVGSLGWAVCAFAVVLAIYGSHYYSVSADIGWHYALSEYLLSERSLPSSKAIHLGPMITYPPAAHVGTALLSLLTGAPLLQVMFLAALLVPLLSYLILTHLARGRSIDEDVSILFCFMFFIAAMSLSRQLHGKEAVHANFFYAQLFGDFACILAFVLISKARNIYLYIGFSISVVYAIAWIYTLSAIRLAAALVLLQLFEVVESSRGKSTRLVPFAVIGVGVAGVLAFHPTFMPMVENARHNGGVTGSSMYGTAAAAIALLIIGALILIRWRAGRATPNQRLLAIFAIALSFSATAQFLAFFALGIGSPYAVKKHSLLIGTLLCFTSAILLSEKIRLWLPSKLKHCSWLGPAIPAVATLFAALMIFPMRGNPYRELILYDSAVRSVIARAGAEFIGKTGSANSGIQPIMNAVVAMAVLRLNAWSPDFIDQMALIGSSEPTNSLKYVIRRERASEDCTVDSYEAEKIYFVRRACITDVVSDKSLR